MARNQRQDDEEQPQRGPAPYQQSRAGLRRFYGTRSIDAGNHQSPADMTPSGQARQRGAGFDDTPSGRIRQMNQRGVVMGDDGKAVDYGNRGVQAAEENKNWDNQFARKNPFQVFQKRAAQPQDPIIQSINEARAIGAPNATFNVPQYGGKVGYSTAQKASTPALSLGPDTPEDASSMFELIGPTGLAQSSALGMGSVLGRSRFRKSVLDSASRWVQPV